MTVAPAPGAECRLFPTAMRAHPPSWSWFNHGYATFMTDPPGLELLHRIGAKIVGLTAIELFGMD